MNMPHPDHVAGQFPHSENHFVLSFVHLLPTEKQVSVRRIREIPSEQAKNSYDWLPANTWKDPNRSVLLCT